MRRIFLIMFLLWSFTCDAQRVTFYDLKVLANKRTWEEVKEILESKGWVFNNSSNKKTVYQTISWAYNKTKQNDKAQLWFSVYVLEGKLWGVNLQVNSRGLYIRLRDEAESQGFKKIETSVYNKGVSVFYMKGKDLLEISTHREEGDGKRSSTEYFNITLLKNIDAGGLCSEVKTKENKGCIYLINSGVDGLRTMYYLTGNKKREGYYKEGKLHGEYREFFNNGDLKLDLCYQDGKLEGWATEYYSNGNKKVRFFTKMIWQKESIRIIMWMVL